MGLALLFSVFFQTHYETHYDVKSGKIKGSPLMINNSFCLMAILFFEPLHGNKMVINNN